MEDSIKELKQIISINTEIYNSLSFQRNRKTTFNDMFYYLTQLVSNPRNSSTTVTTSLNCDNLTNATSDAFKKRRKTINPMFFKFLFNDLLNVFYKNNKNNFFNKYRLLGVDGTHSPLSKNLINDGYKLTKNKTYVNALISGLYDITNNTIIDLNLTSSKNEVVQYKEQFAYLTENDIIIHDRGYYNSKLLYDLHILKNVYAIFRMKDNFKIVRDFKNRKTKNKIYIICNEQTKNIPIKLRLVKYTINDTIYVLGTTLTGKNFTINVLKNLYKQRWSIEEYFKTIKYCLSFKNFHSKTEIQIKQEIYVHMCITAITRILEEIYKKNNIKINNKMKNHKTNFKNNINKVTNNIMILLLYDKTDSINQIIKILSILFTYLIKIRNNRTFLRKAIIPVSRWYQYGEKNK